jgi:glutathione synthase
MDELLKRGHEVYWLEQENLSLHKNQLSGSVARVLSTSPFTLDDEQQLKLDDFNAMVIRKDPPFDKSYLHLTYLLDFLSPHVARINSPAALRNINEKLYTLNWSKNCPDTLTTMRVSLLTSFAHKHGRIVLKPLDDCSGRGIVFLDADAEDLETTLAEYVVAADGTPRFVMAQQYLANVKNGDKRIYLVNGEPVGWVNRIPAEGQDLANIHQGATCHASDLSDRERMLSREIGAELMQEGVILAGLDFIDGHLTEVNITSPSAVRQINAVYDQNLEVQIVDGIIETILANSNPLTLNRVMTGA